MSKKEKIERHMQVLDHMLKKEGFNVQSLTLVAAIDNSVYLLSNLEEQQALRALQHTVDSRTDSIAKEVNERVSSEL